MNKKFVVWECNDYTFPLGRSVGDGFFSGTNLPYKYVANITKEAPTLNCRDNTKFNQIMDTTQEIIIDADVANPFKILSAYFTTSATISPPHDCKIITNHTQESYPQKNPFSLTSLPSVISMVTRPTTAPIAPSCTLRNHTDCLVPFKIFSK